jgi:class 3 adenylate cyclase
MSPSAVRYDQMRRRLEAMTFEEDVRSRTASILSEDWAIRDGQVVPKTGDVAQKNGAVRLDATFLYADLAGSTALQKSYKDTFAAKAIRMYLGGAASIIRRRGGSIKSYDGDRVLGVFVGSSMRNDAVKAAFAIHWLVRQVINPMVKQRHEATKTTPWVARHGIGIDTGTAFVARAGVRNSSGEHTHNDLTFVGRAPNVAAKLSALRGNDAGPIIITHDVYRFLKLEQKKHLNRDIDIWGAAKTERVGSHSLQLYRADYWRTPS